MRRTNNMRFYYRKQTSPRKTKHIGLLSETGAVLCRTLRRLSSPTWASNTAATLVGWVFLLSSVSAIPHLFQLYQYVCNKCVVGNTSSQSHDPGDRTANVSRPSFALLRRSPRASLARLLQQGLFKRTLALKIRQMAAEQKAFNPPRMSNANRLKKVSPFFLKGLYISVEPWARLKNRFSRNRRGLQWFWNMGFVHETRENPATPLKFYFDRRQDHKSLRSGPFNPNLTFIVDLLLTKKQRLPLGLCCEKQKANGREKAMFSWRLSGEVTGGYQLVCVRWLVWVKLVSRNRWKAQVMWRLSSARAP